MSDEYKYIKGKGILVGVFSEDDIVHNRNRIQTEEMQKRTGYNYINTEFCKKNGKIVGLKVYVCSLQDFQYPS